MYNHEYGKAKAEFYNADNIADMFVMVEGITKNGKKECENPIYR